MIYIPLVMLILLMVGSFAVGMGCAALVLMSLYEASTRRRIRELYNVESSKLAAAHARSRCCDPDRSEDHSD